MNYLLMGILPLFAFSCTSNYSEQVISVTLPFEEGGAFSISGHDALLAGNYNTKSKLIELSAVDQVYPIGIKSTHCFTRPDFTCTYDDGQWRIIIRMRNEDCFMRDAKGSAIEMTLVQKSKESYFSYLILAALVLVLILILGLVSLRLRKNETSWNQLDPKYRKKIDEYAEGVNNSSKLN